MSRKRAVALLCAAALGLAGCTAPSSQNSNGSGNQGISQQTKALDPNAKGPAPEVAGARKGGTLIVYSQSTPNTLDPTNTYFVDSAEIEKLVFRTPTQYAFRGGKPVLVPDLTDLGTVSADKLTWTFKMQSGIKYADGSPVKVDDLAYAIKRGFATDVFHYAPTYQKAYFKDGDKYAGPYTGGDSFAGVETPDANTLVIHLAKPFADLPFYMTFPLFTPIPKDKDTRENYQNNPMATGPYQFDGYTPGAELKLKRNPNWDPKTDAARHAYVDGWDFKWAQDDVKTQQQVLNSGGPDADALNYGNVDSTLVPQLQQKPTQLLKGDAPCTIVENLDSRKIPLPVRKALAKAWPVNQILKAGGVSDLVAEPASTIMPPSVPGYTRYQPYPDLTGTGDGDPAGAKKMLQDAGQLNFEISYYYDNTKPIPQQTNQILTNALTSAGFKVNAIGVPTAEVRTKTSDFSAPVNIGQGPAGWCSDWPTGGSWFPTLFESHAIADATSWGAQNDPKLDAQIEAVAALPSDQATAKWADLDKQLMGEYLVIPLYYAKSADVIGTAIGGAEIDGTLGLPLFQNLFLKS
jgi:peptide/nickel transport system substrate-binding protein